MGPKSLCLLPRLTHTRIAKALHAGFGRDAALAGGSNGSFSVRWHRQRSVYSFITLRGLGFYVSSGLSLCLLPCASLPARCPFVRHCSRFALQCASLGSSSARHLVRCCRPSHCPSPSAPCAHTAPTPTIAPRWSTEEGDSVCVLQRGQHGWRKQLVATDCSIGLFVSRNPELRGCKVSVNGRFVLPGDTFAQFGRQPCVVHAGSRLRGGCAAAPPPLGPTPLDAPSAGHRDADPGGRSAVGRCPGIINKPSLARRSLEDDPARHVWKLTTANLTTYAHAAKVSHGCDSDVFLFQEMLRGPEAADSMTAQANANLCHAVVHPSIGTVNGGLSAGVAIWSRWACGLASLPSTPSFANPCPERFAVAHWRGMLPSGILVASVYLYDDSGLSSRNRSLLHQISGYLGAIGKPFILGGDWQMHPDVLRSSGWPALTHAKVAVSGPMHP